MVTIAYLAWPIITVILAIRLSFPKAILVSLIGGFLLLPVSEGINLPVLPTFDKDTIPALSLFVLAMLFHRQLTHVGGDVIPNRPGWLPRSIFALTGLAMVCLGAVLTALTNGDPVVYGSTSIPGLRPYDGASLALTSLTLMLPLFLGRKFFADSEGQALLLKALVIAGLGYSLLALYEIRMSPQLHRMVYGFFQFQFLQQIRGGGFRPVVFTQHGLQLAIFFVTVALAAFGAWRIADRERRRFYLLGGCWLLLTLALSNSFGALAIAMIFLPFIIFLGVRAQLLAASVVAGAILVFPFLRGVDVIPTQTLVSWAGSIDPGRAASLQYRFDNEDILLEHANEKPLFGWGGWRRNRVFEEDGVDISTTDGAWIVLIGQRGWVGYLGQIGLLILPIILLALKRRSYRLEPDTAVLALILAAAVVDLIPNGFLSPLTLLIAGTLWGRLERKAAVSEASPELKLADEPSTAKPRPGAAVSEFGDGRRATVYTRQDPNKRHDRKAP